MMHSIVDHNVADNEKILGDLGYRSTFDCIDERLELARWLGWVY